MYFHAEFYYILSILVHLSTNGLGSCATQYASEYMDVTVWRDGNKYSLHFKKGKVVGAKKKALEIEPSDEDRTGTTTIKWRPDLEVFTSISIPHEWYRETMRRQAVVNANVTFRLRIEGDDETRSILPLTRIWWPA